MPAQDSSVQYHRDLAVGHFSFLPAPVHLFVNLYVSMKWAIFFSPYYTFKVVRLKGDVVKKETGLALWQQYWRVLGVSAGHGLAPVEWYRYRLYEQKKGSLWNYVYDQEVAGFHRHRSHDRPKYRQHVALLGDKQKFEALLVQKGIPTVETLEFIPQNTSGFQQKLEVLVQEHGDLFCKRRTGNQGRGAFRAYQEQDTLHIQPRKELDLSSEKIFAFLKENIRGHDYLIQPNYTNHSLLQTHSEGYLHPASTIRIISRYDDATGAVEPEFAVMHWPVLDDELNTRFHYPISIEPVTGKLEQIHEVWPREGLDDAQVSTLNALLERIDERPMPHWDGALQLSASAHQLLTGVDMIAWDFILTEDRAVLLEGNSGWGGLAVCQWFGFDFMPPIGLNRNK